MEGKDGADPLEISKSPEIIKDAQEDIGKLDVLVCGLCHDVFHYVDQFQEHKKEGKCSGLSIVRENYKHEPKAQVWAFMLWKNAQFKKAKIGESMPTSWTIYQRWCKLDAKEKEAWIIAGQNIQTFTKISSAKIQEIKSRAQPIIKNKIVTPTVQVNKKNIDDEPLEEGEIRLSHLSNTQQVALKAQIAPKKVNAAEDDPFADDEDTAMDVDEADKSKVVKSNDLNKAGTKTVAQNRDLTITPALKKPAESRKVLRTLKNEGTEECTAEKVLSKRFHQKKKILEYLVKWENLNESDNTWEPKAHFEKCTWMLEEFEKILIRPKVVQKQLTHGKEANLKKESDEGSLKTRGRPQRTSKQKALNQVKVWCGDISEGDEASGKRKSFSDDEDDYYSSDSFEKKIKLEEESDSSEDEKPSLTIRRIVKGSNSVNGMAKKTSEETLPAPQRVVHVNQKQLPTLSSGVYIMSKTEGIIKLDSNNPSTGSPLLKVGPKIGQTHIKMVKKEAPTSNVTKTVPKLVKSDAKPVTSTPKPTTKVVTSRKILPPSVKLAVKPEESRFEEKISEDKDAKEKSFDDDSDGLEELEFPKDLPLPEPDSPPGEFTLCPLTGKILGQSDESSEQDESNMENTSLDNLVKLAAAELPDVDLQSSTSSSTKEEDDNKPKETSPVIQTPSVSIVTLKPDGQSSTNTVTSSTSQASTAVTDMETEITPNAIQRNESTTATVSETVTSVVKANTILTATSILNAALTNTHARVAPNPTRLGTPKRLLSSTPNTIRQKVAVNRTPINRPLPPKPSPSTTIIHKLTPSRNKAFLPRPSHSEAPVLKRTSNVTTYKPANVARRIGNTTIYKTTEKATPIINRVAPAVTTSTVKSSTQPSLVQTTTPAVINMPLLTTDEEPSTSADAEARLNEIEPLPSLATDHNLADLSTFSLPESETPLLITGDDGTIYQVAGQNEEGQTILISEGPDGQQQCVIVSSENTTEETPVLAADNPVETQQTEQNIITNTQTDAEPETAEEESQVVAQIIKADPPSPGGTRKVVLMLPDGSLMMTDVTAEQYAALELDK